MDGWFVSNTEKNSDINAFCSYCFEYFLNLTYRVKFTMVSFSALYCSVTCRYLYLFMLQWYQIFGQLSLYLHGNLLSLRSRSLKSYVALTKRGDGKKVKMKGKQGPLNSSELDSKQKTLSGKSFRSHFFTTVSCSVSCAHTSSWLSFSTVVDQSKEG